MVEVSALNADVKVKTTDKGILNLSLYDMNICSSELTVRVLQLVFLSETDSAGYKEQ